MSGATWSCGPARAVLRVVRRRRARCVASPEPRAEEQVLKARDGDVERLPLHAWQSVGSLDVGVDEDAAVRCRRGSESEPGGQRCRGGAPSCLRGE